MIGKKFFTPMAVVATTLACCVASPALGQVTFDWVTVGNPDNGPDPLNQGSGDFGSVAYEYRIGRFEVTNDQYAEFLNAVAVDSDPNDLYSPEMGSDPRGGITQSPPPGVVSYNVKTDMGNKPVNFVSFFDAMRFVNWLHNGQPTGAQGAGTTEDGAYAIIDGLTETRAVDAKFFVPSRDEWYKAAYHQFDEEGGDTDDYWLYPTASNSVPTTATANATGDISNPGENVANFSSGADWNGQNGNVTTVGSAGAGSESFYGTSDQGGNVAEWNEEVPFGTGRGVRGGSWIGGNFALQSSGDNDLSPESEGSTTGFRIASPVPPIPTVSEWGLAAMALLLLGAGTIVYGKRVGRAT